LNDISWLSELQDSIDTDVDSLTLTGNTLTVWEAGNGYDVDLAALAADSAFADSLVSNQYFTDSLISIIQDSLIISKNFRDSIYTFVSDSLLNDTAWLSELRDSIDTDTNTRDPLRQRNLAIRLRLSETTRSRSFVNLGNFNLRMRVYYQADIKVDAIINRVQHNMNFVATEFRILLVNDDTGRTLHSFLFSVGNSAGANYKQAMLMWIFHGIPPGDWTLYVQWRTPNGEARIVNENEYLLFGTGTCVMHATKFYYDRM